MKKIIAIGGGEIGRPGYPTETTKINKEPKLFDKKLGDAYSNNL